MIYQKFLPNPALRNYIHSFSYCEIDRQEDFLCTGWIVPDGYPEIYLFDGEGINISTEQEQINFTQPFACGLYEKKVRYLPSGRFRYWSIKLQPWASSFFYQDNISETTGVYFDLKALGVGVSIEKLNNVWLYKDKIEAKTFLEKVFHKKIDGMNSAQEMVCEAAKQTFSFAGNIQIQQLCKDLNISRQYLERKYKQFIGLSPKSFARVVRVRQIANFVTKNPKTNFTQIAYTFNYADQSHFIRDFKKVIGTSPKQFFKEQHFIIPD